MDLGIILYYIFKICLYIIVIWGAILIILFFIVWLKILRLVSILYEIVEDINEKYFLIEHFVWLPFKFLSNLLNKKKNKWN